MTDAKLTLRVIYSSPWNLDESWTLKRSLEKIINRDKNDENIVRRNREEKF